MSQPLSFLPTSPSVNNEQNGLIKIISMKDSVTSSSRLLTEEQGAGLSHGWAFTFLTLLHA